MATPGTYVTTTSGTFTTAEDTVMLPTITSNIATTNGHYDRHLQSIPTTMTAIAINASVVTPGLFSLRNTDPTNYVEIGLDISGTFTPFAKLSPGDPPMQFRYDGVAIYAQAHTAAVDLAVFVAEA